jgi:hypothetical protein
MGLDDEYYKLRGLNVFMLAKVEAAPAARDQFI